MSLALRYGACGSFFLAAVLLLAALFMPVQEVDPHSTEPVDIGLWTIGGGMLGADGNTTKAGSWYDDDFSGHDGLLRLRLAGPTIILGLLVLLVCGFMVLSGNGIRTGWTATAGLVLCGAGILFFLMGSSAFTRSVTQVNEVLDSDLRPVVGFWSMFVALLLGVGAGLASFSVKPERRGRIGPDGQPLPPLPVLSVENPEAFNPMASRDPRPFRPEEEDHYRSFEVTGGRRTFRTGGEPEAEWPEEAPAPPAEAGRTAPKGAAAPAGATPPAAQGKPDAAGPGKAAAPRKASPAPASASTPASTPSKGPSSGPSAAPPAQRSASSAAPPVGAPGSAKAPPAAGTSAKGPPSKPTPGADKQPAGPGKAKA